MPYPAPIFVIGGGRTGTNLMGEILDSHPEIRCTIEDPETFERPWTMRMPVYKRTGADARLLQFKCVEFVEELLYGHLRKEPLNPERKAP